MQLTSRLQPGFSRTAVHPQAPRITRCRIPCSASKAEAPEPFIPASSSQPSTPASPSPPSPQPALDKQAALQARVDQAYSSMALTEREPAQRSPVQTPTPQKTQVQQFLFPDEEEMPDSLELPIWDHLEELRERVLVALLAASAAIGACFCFSKELVVFLEAPVADAGVRFLQLSPGEFFFTTLKTAGYTGLLVAAPTVLYEIIAYVVPGLTRSERRFLAPVVFGSSILFYLGLLFSYEVLTPAALNFFVDYANGAVESLWSIDQYFEFVLLLMLSTGLSFQVPVVQVMLGQLGLVSSEQMLSQWRYVVVGSTVVAAVLTPSTDPFTQALLAIPLVGLYMAGATAVKFIETQKAAAAAITGSR